VAVFGPVTVAVLPLMVRRERASRRFLDEHPEGPSAP
jgi:hypothetical protein